jgi:hypothetical protein
MRMASRQLSPLSVLSIAVAGSVVLDVLEWTEHHPPAMWLIAVLHFAFVWASLTVVIYGWRRFREPTVH